MAAVMASGGSLRAAMQMRSEKMDEGWRLMSVEREVEITDSLKLIP